MNSSVEEMKQIFENEIKRKLSERAKQIKDEYKTLLNCFKFYDIYNEGKVDKNKWINAILKTGLNSFSENDLDLLYTNYITNNSDKIDYKDFCNYIFGRERTGPSNFSNNNISNLKENSNINPTEIKNCPNNFQNIYLNIFDKNHINRQSKEYEKVYNIKYNNINNNIIKNKSNYNDFEALINKIKEIIHKDNGIVYYSFVKFLKINEEPTSHKVSLEDLSVTIQELHLNISSSEIQELFDYLDSEKKGSIPTDIILNIIKGPLDDKRKTYIKNIFSDIDINKKGEISVNDLKNMYNAKNHPNVIEGKKSEQEIYNQFCYTIDVYIRFYKILNNSINSEQFIDYYSGISPSIKSDEDFKKILENIWNSTNKENDEYISKNNKNGFNFLNNSYDNSFENNDIGINSLFLGVSKSRRPKYDYNYDYLEEFSKSSSNIDNKNINVKKNIIKYKNDEINTDNRNIRNTTINNYMNKDLNNLGDIPNNKIINYSNTVSFTKINNTNKDNKKYFNYESRKTPQYKGIKVYKTKSYNPITDVYIINNDNDTNANTNSINSITQDIIYKIETPKNNLYSNYNKYNKSNSQNDNIIKVEENSANNNIKENIINDGDNEINNNLEEKNVNNINMHQNCELKENSSLILFRKLLISRGIKSIFLFQRMLSIYDRDHSGLISFDNFYTIFQAYYINFPISDTKSIFSLFDGDSNINKNNNNRDIYRDSSMLKIKYNELLKSLVGNMPLKRQILVRKVFDSFDKDNEGNIMTSDIKSKFNYKNHPEVLKGKKAPNEVYSDFLDFLETFREYNDNLKGGYSFTMSFEEFLEFYNEISMSIEDDDYFENLLINCWDISENNNSNDIIEKNILNNNLDNKSKFLQDNNNNENEGKNRNNMNNIRNNYRRINQFNSQNNINNRQNLRIKLGSQIMNNIFN